MNLKDLYTVEKHETGAEMRVKDESGKELDMYITLAGVDSKVFRKAKSELQRRILNGEDNSEELRASALADVSIGWRGFMDDGEEIEFSREIIEQLYNNAPYVMEQADLFINSRENFTKG